MLISNPTDEQWNELRENCLATPEDIAHLTQFLGGHPKPASRGHLKTGQ
jgi:hypothetical protein